MNIITEILPLKIRVQCFTFHMTTGRDQSNQQRWSRGKDRSTWHRNFQYRTGDWFGRRIDRSQVKLVYLWIRSLEVDERYKSRKFCRCQMNRDEEQRRRPCWHTGSSLEEPEKHVRSSMLKGIEILTIVRTHPATKCSSTRRFAVRRCGQRITGIFLRPSLVELAHITGMYTIVQISSGKFFLEPSMNVDRSIRSLTNYLGKLQILSNVVADEVQFEIAVDGEEESIERLEERENPWVSISGALNRYRLSHCWPTDLIDTYRCIADRNHINVFLLVGTRSHWQRLIAFFIDRRKEKETW